jgi:HK97 family phage prohead protease
MDVRSLVPVGQREERQVAFSSCEIRKSGEKRLFVGHAAVFDELSVDLGGFRERIQRGAFRKVLSRSPDVRFLKNHDVNFIFGRTKAGTLRLKEDPKGLWVENDLPDTEAARDFATSVERGDIDGMSFSFRVRPLGEDHWEEEDGELVRTIISFGELFDVGGVVFPAYPQTDAAVRTLAGVQVRDHRGALLERPLLELAWDVYHGRRSVTDLERRLIDSALEELDTVSPWVAERVLRAVSQEPELYGAVIPGKRVRVEDAPAEGESLHWATAARQRHLHQLIRELGVT